MVERSMAGLVALARRLSFRDLAALVPLATGADVLHPVVAGRVQQLCSFGQRLIDLDAEDFGKVYPNVAPATDVPSPAAAIRSVVPPHLVARAAACRVPQSSDAVERGILTSLRPVYALLLEVANARWRRREMLWFLATVHIASEYAPLLAWEATLGHGGDPARLRVDMNCAGSRWGVLEDAACRHTRAFKAAANRALRVSDENPEGWTSYLDRQHSTVSRALAFCAVTCAKPCTVVTRLSEREQSDLRTRNRLALAFAGSALVRLRHSAPVGHGFGVPAPAEVQEAWTRTRRSMARIVPEIGHNDDQPVPGLRAVFSALAGAPIAPDTLVAEVADTIVAELGADRPG
jgi:hypothetical protein